MSTEQPVDTEHMDPTQIPDDYIPDCLYPERTRADVDKLKVNWRSDPCWDLVDTRGFEFHRAELRAYQAACEAEWEAKYAALGNKALEWGELGALVQAQAVVNGIVSDVMAAPHDHTVEGLLAQRAPTLQALATLAQAQALTRLAEVAESWLEMQTPTVAPASISTEQMRRVIDGLTGKRPRTPDED